MTIKPKQLAKLRNRANKTQVEAAIDVHVTTRCWQNWESPEDSVSYRKIPEAYVELFCIKNKIPYPPKF